MWRWSLVPGTELAWANPRRRGSGANAKGRQGKGTKRSRDTPPAERPPPRPKTKRQKALAAEAAEACKHLRQSNLPHKVVDVQGQAVTVIPDGTADEEDVDGRHPVRLQIETAVLVSVAPTTAEDPKREANIIQHIALAKYSHDLMMLGVRPLPDAVRRCSVRAMLEAFALAGGDVDARVNRVMQLCNERHAAA